MGQLETNKIKFDFNDILLTPKVLSDIDSRSEVNPKNLDGFYPIITAPMDMVVSPTNMDSYLVNNIYVATPRNEVHNHPNAFISVSLTEIIDLFDEDKLNPTGKYLIDIANGHMSKLYYAIQIIKKDYPKLILMVGNIANPETYRELSDAGADAIRISIGSGGSCTTGANGGIGYAVGSLIRECYEISCTLDNPALIVADGGMQGFSDIIKALALGADVVMIGGLFNKCIESSGDNYLYGRIKISQKLAEFCFLRNIPIYKKMRGMSTKEVQRKWGSNNVKTSEGITRKNLVEYSISQWVENFDHYLRTAMSYTGCRTLEEFKGKVDFTLISQNAFKRYNK